MTKKTTTRLMTSGKRREMNKIAGRAIVITTHTLRNYAKRVVGVDKKDAIRYVKENKEGLTTQITRILNDARKLTQHENTEFNRRHTIKTKGGVSSHEWTNCVCLRRASFPGYMHYLLSNQLFKILPLYK